MLCTQTCLLWALLPWPCMHSHRLRNCSTPDGQTCCMQRGHGGYFRTGPCHLPAACLAAEHRMALLTHLLQPHHGACYSVMAPAGRSRSLREVWPSTAAGCLATSMPRTAATAIFLLSLASLLKAAERYPAGPTCCCTNPCRYTARKARKRTQAGPRLTRASC